MRNCPVESGSITTGGSASRPGPSVFAKRYAAAVSEPGSAPASPASVTINCPARGMTGSAGNISEVETPSAATSTPTRSERPPSSTRDARIIGINATQPRGPERGDAGMRKVGAHRLVAGHVAFAGQRHQPLDPRPGTRQHLGATIGGNAHRPCEGRQLGDQCVDCAHFGLAGAEHIRRPRRVGRGKQAACRQFAGVEQRAGGQPRHHAGLLRGHRHRAIRGARGGGGGPGGIGHRYPQTGLGQMPRNRGTYDACTGYQHVMVMRPGQGGLRRRLRFANASRDIGTARCKIRGPSYNNV